MSFNNGGPGRADSDSDEDLLHPNNHRSATGLVSSELSSFSSFAPDHIDRPAPIPEEATNTSGASHVATGVGGSGGPLLSAFLEGGNNSSYSTIMAAAMAAGKQGESSGDSESILSTSSGFSDPRLAAAATFMKSVAKKEEAEKKQKKEKEKAPTLGNNNYNSDSVVAAPPPISSSPADAAVSGREIAPPALAPSPSESTAADAHAAPAPLETDVPAADNSPILEPTIMYPPSSRGGGNPTPSSKSQEFYPPQLDLKWQLETIKSEASEVEEQPIVETPQAAEMLGIQASPVVAPQNTVEAETFQGSARTADAQGLEDDDPPQQPDPRSPSQSGTPKSEEASTELEPIIMEAVAEKQKAAKETGPITELSAQQPPSNFDPSSKAEPPPPETETPSEILFQLETLKSEGSSEAEAIIEATAAAEKQKAKESDPIKEFSSEQQPPSDFDPSEIEPPPKAQIPSEIMSLIEPARSQSTYETPTTSILQEQPSLDNTATTTTTLPTIAPEAQLAIAVSRTPTESTSPAQTSSASAPSPEPISLPASAPPNLPAPPIPPAVVPSTDETLPTRVQVTPASTDQASRTTDSSAEEMDAESSEIEIEFEEMKDVSKRGAESPSSGENLTETPESEPTTAPPSPTSSFKIENETDYNVPQIEEIELPKGALETFSHLTNAAIASSPQHQTESSSTAQTPAAVPVPSISPATETAQPNCLPPSPGQSFSSTPQSEPEPIISPSSLTFPESALTTLQVEASTEVVERKSTTTKWGEMETTSTTTTTTTKYAEKLVAPITDEAAELQDLQAVTASELQKLGDARVAPSPTDQEALTTTTTITQMATAVTTTSIFDKQSSNTQQKEPSTSVQNQSEHEPNGLLPNSDHQPQPAQENISPPQTETSEEAKTTVKKTSKVQIVGTPALTSSGASKFLRSQLKTIASGRSLSSQDSMTRQTFKNSLATASRLSPMDSNDGVGGENASDGGNEGGGSRQGSARGARMAAGESGIFGWLRSSTVTITGSGGTTPGRRFANSVVSSSVAIGTISHKVSRRTESLKKNFTQGTIGTTISKGLKARESMMEGNNTSKDSFRESEANRLHNPHAQRRYRVGDSVLVCNHISRWANLVNKYGFPPGEGQTPEERIGPYMYVLATVKKVHFEEIQAYYTVSRMDTQADQRGDAEYMEPIRSKEGEAAALKAATSNPTGQSASDFDKMNADEEEDQSKNKCANFFFDIFYLMILPLLLFKCLVDCIFRLTDKFFLPVGKTLLRFSRKHARLILNGLDPYVCRLRLTCVNFVVICSTYYMFIDQARLAFMPPSWDHSLAVISLCAWVVLVVELLFETFIRPDGYEGLILSDKAYSPTTVRYINNFHLTVETLSLGLFVPEFYCILNGTRCDTPLKFSLQNAALMGVIGPTRHQVFYGRAFFALIRLRVFGLVRHWRNMWIANTFIKMKWKAQGGILSNFIPTQLRTSFADQPKRGKKKVIDPEVEEQKKRDAALTNASTIGTALMATNSYRALGIFWLITGVFPLIFSINFIFVNPTVVNLSKQLQQINLIANATSEDDCEYLRSSVWAWMASVASSDLAHGSHRPDGNPFLLTLDLLPQRCPWQVDSSPITLICQKFYSDLAALENSTSSAVMGMDYLTGMSENEFISDACEAWNKTAISTTPEELADALNLRVGSIVVQYIPNDQAVATTTGIQENITYSVETAFNLSDSVVTACLSALLLQLCLLVGVLGGLSVLRRDAEVLVLGPLRRMLKRIAQYARNPLAQARGATEQPAAKDMARGNYKRKMSGRNLKSGFDSDDSSDGSDDEDDFALGSYETEQLIAAVTNITDLLRKCWGVAGADIISTNLATREGALSEVFNPTVPGKSVYAIFGFAMINRFNYALTNLQGDVMILINDVAAVLHGEVGRWAFQEKGECNKNLGNAFLMVFRIGFVTEVIEKLEQATDVVFSTGTSRGSTSLAAARRRLKSSSTSGSGKSRESAVLSRRQGSSKHFSTNSRAMHGGRKAKNQSVHTKAMSLSLQKLPGIRPFTDRAVIGMLKSYAGIYRDKKILNWNKDLRLSCGVGGVFEVSMIFGMDAGWAVEGAVGSEYKIDATYLSPHVNMASRMMMASKQYGVTIMLSQAVQELMTDVARKKLRHLDTVTVKGSSIRQNIYTYDARNKGVDFFLYSRSDEQATLDAKRYTQSIWNDDQDLTAMRRHATDEFVETFNSGMKHYLGGDWPKAIELLERANEIMVEAAFEDGYQEDEFENLHAHAGQDVAAAEEELKEKNGDGPSIYLLKFMKEYDGVAPAGWEGWHPLTRK